MKKLIAIWAKWFQYSIFECAYVYYPPSYFESDEEKSLSENSNVENVG